MEFKIKPQNDWFEMFLMAATPFRSRRPWEVHKDISMICLSCEECTQHSLWPKRATLKGLKHLLIMFKTVFTSGASLRCLKMLFMLAAHSVWKQSLDSSIQKTRRFLTSMLGFHMWSWAALRWFHPSWGSSPVPAAWYIPPGTGSKPCGPECPAIYIMPKTHIKQACINNQELVNLPICIRLIQALYLVMIVLAHVLRTRVEPFTGTGTWITRSAGL